jgi:hypothetical protein
MKKILFVAGIIMASYTNILADTEWTTPVGDDGKYADNLNEWIKLEVPNAENITVTIDGQTERYYDHVYIWNDDNSTSLKSLHGYIAESFDVDGNSINVNFKSDYSIAKSGVTVTVEKKNNKIGDEVVIGSLHVENNAVIDGNLQVKGQILDADGNPMLKGGDFHFTDNGNNIEYANGDLKITNGFVQVGVSDATCDLENEGAIRYNQTAKNMEFCDGAKWFYFTKQYANTSCKTLLDAGDSIGDGVYEIDPDGAGGVEPFDVYCDMTTDGGGWTKVAYIEDLEYKQHFSGADAWRYLPNNFSLELSNAQINAIRVVSKEAKQKYVGRCNGMIHYWISDYYTHAIRFKFHDQTATNRGEQNYDHDVTIIQDGCKTNGGEGGDLDQATIFDIRDLSLPIINVETNDNGGAGELFGSPLTDNPAWFR